jgi:hypothetical protein
MHVVFSHMRPPATPASNHNRIARWSIDARSLLWRTREASVGYLGAIKQPSTAQTSPHSSTVVDHISIAGLSLLCRERPRPHPRFDLAASARRPGTARHGLERSSGQRAVTWRSCVQEHNATRGRGRLWSLSAGYRHQDLSGAA